MALSTVWPHNRPHWPVLMCWFAFSFPTDILICFHSLPSRRRSFCAWRRGGEAWSCRACRAPRLPGPRRGPRCSRRSGSSGTTPFSFTWSSGGYSCTGGWATGPTRATSRCTQRWVGTVEQLGWSLSLSTRCHGLAADQESDCYPSNPLLIWGEGEVSWSCRVQQQGLPDGPGAIRRSTWASSLVSHVPEKKCLVLLFFTQWYKHCLLLSALSLAHFSLLHLFWPIRLDATSDRGSGNIELRKGHRKGRGGCSACNAVSWISLICYCFSLVNAFKPLSVLSMNAVGGTRAMMEFYS